MVMFYVQENIDPGAKTRVTCMSNQSNNFKPETTNLTRIYSASNYEKPVWNKNESAATPQTTNKINLWRNRVSRELTRGWWKLSWKNIDNNKKEHKDIEMAAYCTAYYTTINHDDQPTEGKEQ